MLTKTDSFSGTAYDWPIPVEEAEGSTTTGAGDLTVGGHMMSERAQIHDVRLEWTNVFPHHVYIVEFSTRDGYCIRKLRFSQFAAVCESLGIPNVPPRIPLSTCWPGLARYRMEAFQAILDSGVDLKPFLDVSAGSSLPTPFAPVEV
jgi:hypothetical protein